jgi:hypothetical protein
LDCGYSIRFHGGSTGISQDNLSGQTTGGIFYSSAIARGSVVLKGFSWISKFIAASNIGTGSNNEIIYIVTFLKSAPLIFILFFALKSVFEIPQL